MCGRFVQQSSGAVLARLLGLRDAPASAPRFNVAPTQPILAVRREREGAGPEREAAALRWGLIPSWAKDESFGSRTFNARAETVASKPSFRAAFKRRPCLIPADGFYEWRREGKTRRQPHYIHGRGEEPLVFAGLWESWLAPDGSELESGTIITTEANEAMSALHHRMPVILAPEAFGTWLGEGGEEPEAREALLVPCPDDWLAMHEVERRVGDVRQDDEGLIEPKPPEPRQLSLL